MTLPRAFYERTAVRATMLTAANVAVVIGAGPLAFASDSLVVFVGAFVLVGARAQALYILQHECMHWLLYRSRRANDLCGTLLSGLLGTGLNFGRFLHFKHHRTVGKADDPNRVWHDTGLHAPGWSTFWFFIGQAAGMRLLALLAQRIGAFTGRPPAPIPRSSLADAARIRSDVVVVLVVQAALFVFITAVSAYWVYLLCFLLPLITLTSFFEAVRSFAEHVLPGEHSDTPAEDARLFFMDAGGVERFFFSQFGFHYHHLHHLYPGVVTFKLPALHRWLSEHDPGYAAKYLRRDGYVRTAIRYIMGRPLVVEGLT